MQYGMHFQKSTSIGKICLHVTFCRKSFPELSYDDKIATWLKSAHEELERNKQWAQCELNLRGLVVIGIPCKSWSSEDELLYLIWPFGSIYNVNPKLQHLRAIGRVSFYKYIHIWIHSGVLLPHFLNQNSSLDFYQVESPDLVSLEISNDNPIVIQEKQSNCYSCVTPQSIF